MCSRGCPSLFWLLHNSRRRAQERQPSVRPGPEPPGLKHYALKVGANGEVTLSIAGCLLQDAQHRYSRIREDTKQLKLKTALCMQATSGLGYALSKCHITYKEYEQVCMDLAELVEEYEPELMRLPGNAPKYALAQAVQEYGFSKQRALRMLQRAKVILLNNNPSQFIGHALGQIAAASQGKGDQKFVVESCGEGTRCFEIAEVLKDFKQDLLEGQRKAAERHSMRVQGLEQQILTATQEGQRVSVCNQGLEGQLHAVIIREIALRRAFYAQRRQLASMASQAKNDTAQHQADSEALQMYADDVVASNAVLQHRAEDAEAANATLGKKAQAADEVCSSVQMRLHESQQANKSLRCHLNEQEQVVQGLRADSANLQTELSAEQERASDAEQRAQLLKSQLKTEEQKTGELVATLADEHAQALQAVQGELNTANTKLADSQKDILAIHQIAERLQNQMTAAEGNASALQMQLTAAQQALLTEQQGHMDARQTSAGLHASLQATEERSLHLQTQLDKAQKQMSVDAQAHEVAISECQRQVRAVQQTGASLQTKWEEGQQELASEKQAHQAAKQTVAEVQVELGKEAGRASSLQQDLQEAHQDLASLKQATLAGGEAIESQPLEEAAQHRPSTLQDEPALAEDMSRKATQQQAAAEKQAQEEADWTSPSYQTPVQGAQQIVSALRTQVKAVQQELAGKTANEPVNRTVSGVQADLQAAEQQLSVGLSLQQAHQAGDHTSSDLHMQLDQASPGHTQCLQEGAHGNWIGEQAGAEAVAALGHQLAGLGHQVEEATQRRPSPQQDEQTLAEEVFKGQAKHGTPTAPIQQETPDRDPNTLLDMHGTPAGLASMRQARQAGQAARVAAHMHLEEATLHRPSSLQEPHGSDAELNEVTKSRPEADDPSQLMAALRQAQASAAPQDEAALTEEVPRGQAKHGTPTAPLQQETPGRDTTTLKDDHGMQQEIQDLQQELHLSKDRLQEQNATIDLLQHEAEVSWQEMNGRHEELSQQVKSLKASLRRAGDEDVYRHDIREYKKSPEVFDQYGDPVRPTESLKAMWPEIGLPPPTDPRLVKCVVHLNMPPQELAFHVPRYGLVTTANCKQLMLLLEDRHGEDGVENQDLGLTLLRTVQSVWVAAHLIPWAHHNMDLGHQGISGRPPLSPADQRCWFTVISRESLQAAYAKYIKPMQ